MTTHKNIPLVSIGLPVYNGENFLDQAIESLLSQTCSDLELIISDNGSTDSTIDICHKFAAADSRVKCIENATDLGAAANFRKVFLESRGKYFKWAAHDDLIAPEYLETCLSILEKQEDIILCHSQVTVIDEKGNTIRNDSLTDHNLESNDPAQRFHTLITNDLDNYEVFGLIRSDDLRKTPLISGFIASDRTLRAEIGLRGKIHILQAPLFLCRDHSQRSIRSMPTHQERDTWFDPALSGKFTLPHWRIFYEYFKCIGRVDSLTVSDRCKCSLSVVRWLFIHHNWARMASDPLLAIFPSLKKICIRIGRKLCNE